MCFELEHAWVLCRALLCLFKWLGYLYSLLHMHITTLPSNIIQASLKHVSHVDTHYLPRYSSAAIFLCRIVSCPSKQCLWSIPPMLIAVAPLMMRQETRPVRNISSARSLPARSHLSLCSLGGSQDLTLLWPRGRENGSSIWFRETLANAVIYKQNNTSFFSRHVLQVNS